MPQTAPTAGTQANRTSASQALQNSMRQRENQAADPLGCGNKKTPPEFRRSFRVLISALAGGKNYSSESNAGFSLAVTWRRS